MTVLPVTSALRVENSPSRAAKDVGLRLDGDAAGRKHLSVAREGQVEFRKIAAKAIRPEHQLLKGAGARCRCMGALDSAPPEDFLEKGIIVPGLDQA